MRAIRGFYRTGDNTNLMLANFRRADQDKNDYLDQGELPGVGLGNDFAAIDSNGDGMIVRDEVARYVDRRALVERTRILLNVEQDGQSLFAMMDKNRDRRLSERELKSGFERIRSLDVDGDARIAPTEFSEKFILRFELGKPAGWTFNDMRQTTQNMQTDANIPQTSRLPGPLWFRRMDRNRDRDVSRREFLGTAEQFEQADTDGDGLIDSQEAERIGSRQVETD